MQRIFGEQILRKSHECFFVNMTCIISVSIKNTNLQNNNYFIRLFKVPVYFYWYIHFFHKSDLQIYLTQNISCQTVLETITHFLDEIGTLNYCTANQWRVYSCLLCVSAIFIGYIFYWPFTSCLWRFKVCAKLPKTSTKVCVVYIRVPSVLMLKFGMLLLTSIAVSSSHSFMTTYRVHWEYVLL